MRARADRRPRVPSPPRRLPATAISSHSAADRLAAAERWLRDRLQDGEVLVVAPERGTADDFVRGFAATCPATFGITRAGLRELVTRLAVPRLAADGVTIATGFGLEALIARIIDQAIAAGTVSYFRSVADRPGFRRSLLTTIAETRLAGLPADRLRDAPRTGEDLAALVHAYEETLAAERVADFALVLREAIAALEHAPPLVAGRHVVVLDVPFHSALERSLFDALCSCAAGVLVTIPAGDVETIAAVAASGVDIGAAPTVAPAHTLGQVQRALFQESFDAPDPREPASSMAAPPAAPVEFFSAPGEGREAIEIARRILGEAARGKPFDAMAVVVRAPQNYAAHIEAAFHRARIPAWYSRGTRRPDPAGRAFLALIGCALEGLSARGFAEFVALATLPGIPQDSHPWQPPDDEALADARVEQDAPAADGDVDGSDAPQAPARRPWRWERLLNQAAVLGGADRWRRRLAGLDRELALRLQQLELEDPDAPEHARLIAERETLTTLRAFALPVIEELEDWPAAATWGEWRVRLEQLAPRVLDAPARVLAVLADLRPLDGLGPVSLSEVREVLADRLVDLHVPPPARRGGRVFVGSPESMRGRCFDVVFVAGLGERVFPQRIRQDPLLLDDARRAVNRDASAGALQEGLPLEGVASPRLLALDEHRAADERLRLHLAVGAARTQLYASFASMDGATARVRVPSFYALDVHRAWTGRLPDHDALSAAAAAAAGARLAWPAPDDPSSAIDAAEHDLSTLRRWLHARTVDNPRGRARYLLELSPALGRSLRARFGRWRSRWSSYDGLFGETQVRTALSPFRLKARAYSPSALQRFASCPYQFYLASVLRLAPRTEPAPLQQLDPLTRGSLMHDVIAAVTRRLMATGGWPGTPEQLPPALSLLDAVLDEAAERYRDELAPPIDRVWREEIATIRANLRRWLALAHHDASWMPRHVELGIGFGPEQDARDAASSASPAVLPDGWQLHGVVDVVERHVSTNALRVTDYKTGRDPVRGGFMVGGGSVLQPTLYAMGVESVLGQAVSESRLLFCTARGGFASRPVAVGRDSAAQRACIEVLEIVDRALELGFLPQAPRPDACERCDFRGVCGPLEERRLKLKDADPLGDLRALRALK